MTKFYKLLTSLKQNFWSQSQFQIPLLLLNLSISCPRQGRLRVKDLVQYGQMPSICQRARS